MCSSDLITQENLYPVTADRLWSALTDPQKIEKWLMKNSFQPGLGSRFQLDAGQWGMIEAEITIWEPQQRLCYTWKNGALDTTLSLSLEAEAEGTRLRLEHSGFDLAHPQQAYAYQTMGGGWKQILEGRLGPLL